MAANHLNPTALRLAAALSLLLMLGACLPAASNPTLVIQPTATFPPHTPTAAATTAAPLPSAPPLPPTLTASASPLPPTITPTKSKPTNTPAPTSTLIPTSPYISKTIRLPNPGAFVLNFEQGFAWAAIGNNIYKIDPVTGKSLQTTKFGCEVCFGACDTWAATSFGQVFWALQYGGIGPQDCSASDPWKSIGFMLRRVKAGATTSELIDISDIMQTSQGPEFSRIAANDEKVWLADGNVIFAIDIAKSKPDEPAFQTILPGIVVEGLLFADNTLWAGGEALLAIDPKTNQVKGIYPLQAELLAFDGKRIWGVSLLELWLQSVDIQSKELSDPIQLPEDDMPSAIGISGKTIWVAFKYSTKVAVIPMD